MKRLRKLLFAVMAVAAMLPYTGNAARKGEKKSEKVIVAYVTSWSKIMPDPQYMTHINYAFGSVSETFNGVTVDNEQRLGDIAAIKHQYPSMKVMLSVGGWGSGRFSEMAADDALRKAFALDCRRVVNQYRLDGIDIDWEYPTSNAAGISASPDDTRNFTLLMRDIRKAIGKKKLLTIATVASAQYIDFNAIMPYVNFVNIMSYDMGGAPKHHSALYESANTGWMTAHGAVQAHIKAGVPAEKLVLGMPFYGRGGTVYPNFQDYSKICKDKNYVECWDDEAQVPYLADKDGKLVCGYDNPRSLAIKCRYVLEHGLLGAMYWDYAGDNDQNDLRRTVYEGIMKAK